jgi:nucleoside-diphosphate-sugar epimerase
MTIIVTGAAGLIGGALTRALHAAGRRVVATDLRPAGSAEAPVRLVDLEDPRAVVALAREHEGATVVHCGAVSGPMVVGGDPRRAFAINVGGALNVAEAARQAQVRRFIALSSLSVYGDQDGMAPVAETAPLRASDVYGASKIAMETVLRAYRTALGAPATVLRVASVYGPGRTTACFVRAMIEAAQRGAAFPVAADGPGRRQFVHIDDVVRALVRAIDAPALPEFAYNIGGGSWSTERAVAALAASVLPGLVLRESEAPGEALDGRMGPLDSSLALRDFGYRPEVGLAEGVAAYAEHLKRAPF